ncbi:MAG TPA: HEAT repeat domain-containing protein [Thermoanaerobaculia bacterium]|nr:HEAT repeat domain-containing protein [Thermoanaerobaculia bacterium]
MSDCNVIQERMPQLLIEALNGSDREDSHQHIELCAICREEWLELRAAWAELGELPEVPVPPMMRSRFLERIGQTPSRVIPFRRPEWPRWAAQAAAVALLVGGSFWTGRTLAPATITPSAGVAQATEAPYRITGSRVIPASSLSREIEGTPRIDNVRYVPDGNGGIRLAFNLTSEVTVTGNAGDESLATLMAYVLESRENPDQSRSATIQYIRDNWSGGGKASPEIARALATVLRSDSNEGVRLKALDALRSLPHQATPDAQTALIEALKNDPNPAVRLKAVEALAEMATAGTPLDPSMVDTLREKADQGDENLYVRVKAAEALSQIDL